MIPLALFIYGTAIGSFLNVLIDRLPHDQPITGRSHCDYCKKKLAGQDLIPVVSFFLLDGRCRYCKKKLSYFYPFVEVLTGLTFAMVWILIPGNIVTKIIYLGIFSCLITIFFADYKYQIIPDEVQIALMIFVLALTVLMPGGPLMWSLFRKLLAGVAVMTPILLIYLLTQAKGMGFGDVKYAFIMGFLLGIHGGITALFIAFVTGAAVGLLMIAGGRKKMKSAIAFGPFLVIGTIAVIFYGPGVLPYMFYPFGFP